MRLIDAVSEYADIVLALPLIYNGERIKSVHGKKIGMRIYATHYITAHGEKKQFSKPQILH